MAAQNYTLVFTDTGDSGTGPYTATMYLNPTTAAAGGTQTTLTYAPGAYGLQDIAYFYIRRMCDSNAQFWDTDPLN